MLPSEILTNAKFLIANESNWIKGRWRDSDDEPTCFCAGGAIFQTTDWEYWPSAYQYIGKALGHNTFSLSQLVDWNDAPERTHQEVMIAFDKAIELAIEEGD